MAETNYSDSSQILGLGKTPAQWVEVMAGLGIDISERTLRERANETGAFYRLGRTMLITPAQIDTILKEASHAAPNLQEGPCLLGQGVD